MMKTLQYPGKVPRMAAYLIVNTDIHDPALYEQYKAGVPALIKKHGGEYLARGGEFEVFEGAWHPKRVVLLRFPSLEAARALLNDPNYQPFKKIRHSAAHADIVGVEGL
jgi:uncharacterized protein (DUF1330 family)